MFIAVTFAPALTKISSSTMLSTPPDTATPICCFLSNEISIDFNYIKYH